MTKVTQAHVEARTRDILGAAMEMFAGKGVDGSTMQEIAAEAGLSAGAIYRYFPSKEHLLRSVFTYCAEENRRTFEQVVAESGSPRNALLAVGERAWAALGSAGAREQSIMSLEMALAAVRQPEELGPERRLLLNGLLELIERLVREAQEAGELDRRVDSRALALMLLACHLGTELFALQLGESVETERVFDVVREVVRRLAPETT